MTFTSKKINIPLSKLIPSMITIMALCLGITSIRYSLDGKFNIAVALIIIAAFLDGIDGRVARLLNSTSEFGAQLDSLADLCSFGVAPAIAVYLWSLNEIPYKGVGWGIVLVYIACSALRLARFNTQIFDHESKNKEVKNNFFIGVPMPVAAGLLLIPLMCSFEIFKSNLLINSYWFIAFYMIFIGLLMISKIPIYSGKKISVPKERVNLFLILSGIVFTGIIFEPWFLLPIIGLLYIILIPIGSIYYYCKIIKNKDIRTTKISVILVIAFVLMTQSNVKASEYNHSDSIHCLNAIKIFEKKYNIPKNFLYLISLVESGRYNNISKTAQPWPWSVNINGRSEYFKSKTELVSALKKYVASGKENFDIGCNQINYKFHKHNFSSIEQMASPYYNVGYSAYYLASNYLKTNNWQEAVAMYHSKNPYHGSKYIKKIKQTAKTSGSLLMALNTSKKSVINKSFNLNSKVISNSNTNSRLISKKSIGIMVYNNSNKYDDIIKIPKELG